MSLLRATVLIVFLLAGPALAQTGVLQLPPPGAPPPTTVYGQPAHPRADPVTPVQKVEPGSHARKKPTPVVRAPAKPVAERPPAAVQPRVTPPPAPPATKPPPQPDVGTITGLKLPRFVSLRSDEVNMRVGPGTRFPIEWQYHRRNLPVEILRELDVWRLVEDEDGIKGWVHQATLIGHRSFVVKKGPDAVMRRAPEDAAEPVAKLRPDVVGRIRSCASGAAWCQVQVEDYRGYLRRDQFWGTFPGEAVN